MFFFEEEEEEKREDKENKFGEEGELEENDISG
jgi:hypothetical protein